MKQDKVILMEPHHDKNYSVVMYSYKPELINKFIEICNRFSKQYCMFWQSGSVPNSNGKYPEYQMFEFWIAEQSKMLDAALLIAEEMGMELEFLNPVK